VNSGKPIVGITMGDAAGIGPEIIVIEKRGRDYFSLIK